MKLGLFFGAGAEVSYGLPSGGKFAIELFRQNNSILKTNLRNELSAINERSSYATSWLPKNYNSCRIHAFGKNEFTSLIESSIEYKKTQLISRLNNIDVEAEKALSDLSIDKTLFTDKFRAKANIGYGDELYSHSIKINPVLANDVKLFESEFYSAVLDIMKKSPETPNLRRYASAFIQLLVGAYGQDLVQRLNREIFEQAPDDISIFDDITGMFKVEYNKVGLTALELLLEETPEYDIQNGDIDILICAVSQQIIENLFIEVLDYQSLIDTHFRYLFSPQKDWAKFTKMVLFLRATREYISSQFNPSTIGNDGYYNDLHNIINNNIDIEAIGTANYNNIIEEVSTNNQITLPKIFHLNGGINDYYNPYTNSVETIQDPNDVPDDQINVPFILTQSGVKPLTSVNMSRRYVELYDRYALCDKVVVIGYGFNIDDSHINGLFRKLIDEKQVKLCWISVNNEKSNEEIKRELINRLRINSSNKDLISVILVDSLTREFDNQKWYELIN